MNMLCDQVRAVWTTAIPERTQVKYQVLVGAPAQLGRVEGRAQEAGTAARFQRGWVLIWVWNPARKMGGVHFLSLYRSIGVRGLQVVEGNHKINTLTCSKK